MKKLVSVIILVVLVIAGVFLYRDTFHTVLPEKSQTENVATSTPEWLTYINTAGGYSIEYPSDLQAYAYDIMSGYPGVTRVRTLAGKIDTALGPKSDPQYHLIEIFVDDVPFKTPDEWIVSRNETTSKQTESVYVLKIEKHININGVDASVTTSSKEGNGLTYFDVFMVHDGLGYIISGASDDAIPGRSDAVASTTLERVWSSFKLIPKNL